MTHSGQQVLMGDQARSSSPLGDRALTVALLVALGYYLGATIGFALTLPPGPISTLWPSNAILLAALLLLPVRTWWLVLLAVLPAHMLVQFQSGIPLDMAVGWFVSNSSEALIGAGLVRHFVGGPLRLHSFRELTGFLLGAVFLGTFFSTFVDAGFVALSGWGEARFWDLWQTRFFSNVLATLTLVPVIVTWIGSDPASVRLANHWRLLEATLLAVSTLGASFLVFSREIAGPGSSPALLYAPLPFLVWAAVRFGPRGTSLAILAVSTLAIVEAVKGHGPFLTSSPEQNALSLQLFLIVVSVPLLAVSVLMREREQAERAALESEERLHLVLDAAQVGTWEWRLVEYQGFGAGRSEIILPDFLGSIMPEDRAAVAQAIHRAIAERAPYECEFRVVGPDSNVRWIMVKGEALYDQAGRAQRVLGVNVDITERKATEELRREEQALRKSEARLRELANAMPQIVWTARADGQLDYLNRRWYDITGAEESILADEGWLGMTHPDDRQPTLDAWQRAVATGQPCEVEHRLRIAETNTYRWHLARALPVRNAAGTIVRWYGSCTDIEDQKSVEQELREARQRLEERVGQRTADLSAAVVALQEEIADRVAAERALRSSEERFGKAFHSSPNAIAIIRQTDYRYLEINERWEALSGHPRTEVIGRSSQELGLIVHDEQRLLARSLLETKGQLHEFELDVRNKSGEVLRIVLDTDTVDMAGEPCYIVIIRDVTERKRAEAMVQEQQRELAHLSRVAALGELSGALAHELNQPLAAILANARAAQRIMRTHEPDLVELRAILDDIAMDDQRAGDVIRRLRVLLKKEDSRPGPVDLNEVVTEVLSLLHSDLIQRRISVVPLIQSNLPLVLGDRVQLDQVLLNLVLNACDAMAEVEPAHRQVRIKTCQPAEGGVEMSVSDNGIGIAEEKLDQIFEPFVTTKEQGLGLGLAICRSIVTAHGGRLWVVNNSERGATFHVHLDGMQGEVPVQSVVGATADSSS